MPKIGFWQLLLDDRLSWWEAQRINEAHDAADVAQSIADSAHTRAYSLETRINQMGREIVMLRTALTVLTKTLKDSKVLDERLLDARLEAAMEEAAAQLPRPPPGTGATSGAPINATSMNAVLHQSTAAPATATLTCVTCRKQVPANTTLMTADGPMCERCPA